MSEIRYDPLYDSHVIIAPERVRRPDSYPKQERIQGEESCPFCIGNESKTPPAIYTLIEEGSGHWQTRVVPNLFKALAIEAPWHYHEGSFGHWEGFGAHEIIIDIPRHLTSISQWNQDDIFGWLKTLQSRFHDLRGDKRLQYISLFKNEGYDAGATMEHSHTQLLALPLIPEREAHYYRRSREHYSIHSKALLTSLAEAEWSEGTRWIADQQGFGVYAPYGSSFAFETMIVSMDGVSFGDLSLSGFETLKNLIYRVVQALRIQLGEVAYNLSFITQPLHADDTRAFPFALRITPRMYRFGGFEVSSQMMINPVSPEEAAELLRGAINGQ